MKQQSIMLAAAFAAILPSAAMAALGGCTPPTCRTGTCNNYAWNAEKCTFSCVGACDCDGDSYICTSDKPELTINCTNDSDCFTGYECNLVTLICEKCNGCSNCTSDTTWGASSTGYETKATRTCKCNSCIEEYSFRCAAGYYGNPTITTSGCTACPTGGTSAPGAKAKTECYIPAGTTQSDSTGTYVITSNCYYSN